MISKPLFLSGEVVSLEPLKPEHVEALMRVARSNETAFRFTSTPISARARDLYFDKAFRDADAGRGYPFAMKENLGGRVIGTTRFTDIDWNDRVCELGYTWFDPLLFGSAVNIECKWLLLNHLFESLDWLRVQLNVNTRNVRSRKAVEAFGGIYEGTLRSHKFTGDGNLRDTAVYSVIRADWPDIKPVMQARLSSKLSARST